MFNLFGKRKDNEDSKGSSSSSSVINTISRLKNQLDLLDKRNALLETKTLLLINEIIEVNKTNKKKALILLDKKKRMDGEILKNEGIKILLEKQIAALESSVINRQVTDALREGNNVVKSAQKTMNVDQIEDLMDDIRETEETHQTIVDAFSMNLQDTYDNSDLLLELNDIVGQEQEKQTQPSIIRIPLVPNNPILSKTTTAIHNTEDEDEEEIRKLQKSMLA